MPTKTTKKVSTKQQQYNEFLAIIINKFGSGDHPVATSDTIKFFTYDYIAECVFKSYQNLKK